MWIFGYGSLIWRPAFPFAERREGTVRGFERRFYQGSPDHRGVPGRPGRVVTLLANPRASTWGVAYRIEPRDADGILEALDHREVAGYERVDLDVFTRDGDVIRGALTYAATEDNPCWLGPAPVAAMARQIAECEGPSGTNVEYLFELHQALEEMGADDDHVAGLVAEVQRIRGE